MANWLIEAMYGICAGPSEANYLHSHPLRWPRLVGRLPAVPELCLSEKASWSRSASSSCFVMDWSHRIAHHKKPTIHNSHSTFYVIRLRFSLSFAVCFATRVLSTLFDCFPFCIAIIDRSIDRSIHRSFVGASLLPRSSVCILYFWEMLRVGANNLAPLA